MIIIRLDRVLADRKMRLNDLAAQVGISNVNLSYLKTGKVKAVRFSTLDAICKVLHCQPGDILEYVEAEDCVNSSGSGASAGGMAADQENRSSENRGTGSQISVETSP